MAMVNIEALDSHAGKYDKCQWMHKISMPNQAIYINLGTIKIISKIDSGSTRAKKTLMMSHPGIDRL